MKNYFLDPNTNDVVLTDAKNLRFTTTLTEYTAQKIKNVLSLFSGEWFLNTGLGIPWFDRILIKNADLNDVNNLFQSEILNIAEVKEIVEFNTNFNNTIREYSVDFKVIAEDLITGEVEVTGSTPLLI